MDASRLVVYASVALMVALTVLSGPVVGAVDLTTPVVHGAVGEGNVTVESVEAPATARIDRGLQSESYYLKVPDTRVRASSITGKPVVSYRIEIPGLNYTRSTAHFLDSDDAGVVAFSIAEDTLGSDRVDAERYGGRIRLVVRGTTEWVVYEGTVTVEVTE
ncbi:hypothetical protein BRC92_07055 [Halobacteriales archaeon QS_4_69_31]|nr:MAG: hypothetical protein BRC92_07055 [Halobacteriales archaeon QS_4_69_31]